MSMGCRAIIKEQPQSQSELLELVAAGQRRAFDTLIRQIEDQVLRTALYLTRNLQDAEDVAQEVYVRLVRNRTKLREVENFNAWVNRITLNAARDHLRRRRFWLPLEAIQAWVSPRDRVESGQIDDRLRAAMQSLSLKQRAAFVFRELHSLSYEEVAAILECSETTARGHLMQARRKIQATLLEFRK